MRSKTVLPQKETTLSHPSALGAEVAIAPGEKKRSVPLSAVVILTVLLLVSAGAATYFYFQYKKFGSAKSMEAEEIERLSGEVGAIFELPNETPTLATVTDKEKLAEQPFFEKAENGDKVLFYSQVGKAILYRPGTKKIIDVTSINVVDQQSSGTTAGAGVAPSVPNPVAPTVALYNGSKKTGATNAIEETILAEYSNVTVARKEKATKDDYTGVSVVDLSGSHADLSKSLAESLGGTVATSLPAGETNPGADILVLVGN